MSDFDSKVQQLASEAMDIPEAELDAWLVGACGGDAVLAEDVRSEVRMLGGEGATVESDSGGTPPPIAVPPARLPATIGDFKIRRLLGVGGMGAVYEATQDTPRRKVAVKVMKRGVASGTALRRFQLESQMLARLHHPGIAQVYEAGTWDDGTGGVPYFAMELIVGSRPLTKYAVEKNLDTRARIELFEGICDAIHHGHQKGIMHRDLKPGNILVDRQGNPKVIDFGVARSTDSDLAVTTQQTDVGSLVGTLQYMSPEQCEADPDLIDTRCDIYALGVILYELLSGELPYDIRGMPIYDAARVVREQTPTRVSSVNPVLKGDLETIISKAMAKDPDYRYQSALELKQDLERYLRGDPISARPLSLTYQLSLLVRRNRAAVIGVLAVAVVLVLATILSIVLAVRANIAGDAAIAAQAEAEAELSKAEAGQAFLSHILGMASPRNAQGRTLSTRQVLREAAAGIDARFAGLPELAAETRLTIGELMFELQMFEDADQQLTAGIAAIEARQGPDDPRVLHALTVMGRMRTEQGRPRQADQVTSNALERARRSLSQDDPILIEAIGGRVLALEFLTRITEVIVLSQEWLDLARRRHGEEHEQTLEAMAVHGRTLLTNSGVGTDQEAMSAMATEGLVLVETVFETGGRVLGARHPITLQAQTVVALVQWGKALEEGRLEGEELALTQATEDLQAVLGEDHTAVLKTVHSHGLLSYIAGAGLGDDEMLARGEALLTRAHDGYQRRFGPDNPLTKDVLVRLTQARASISGETIDLQSLRETYEQLLEVHAPDHHAVLNARAVLAAYLLRDGNIEEGEPLMRTSLEYIEGLLGPYHPTMRQLRTLLLGALVESDQGDRALAQTEAWLGEARADLGAEHEDFISLQVHAAGMFEYVERAEEALALLEEAAAAAREHLDTDSSIRASAVRNYAAALLKRDESAAALKLIDEAIDGHTTAEEPDATNGMRLQVLRADALARLDQVDQARAVLGPLLSGGHDDEVSVLDVVTYMLNRDSSRLLDLDADALMAAAVSGHEQAEKGGARVLARLHATRGEHAEAVHWQEQHLAAAKPVEREGRQTQLDEYRATLAEAEGEPAEIVEGTEEVVETPTGP